MTVNAPSPLQRSGWSFPPWATQPQRAGRMPIAAKKKNNLVLVEPMRPLSTSVAYQ